jgi:hypothetical protein
MREDYIPLCLLNLCANFFLANSIWSLNNIELATGLTLFHNCTTSTTLLFLELTVFGTRIKQELTDGWLQGSFFPSVHFCAAYLMNSVDGSSYGSNIDSFSNTGNLIG